MTQGAVKDTTGYVNYVYNISARGTAQVTSQLLGMSGVASNILGQLAFQTSSYLSTTEGAMLSLGTVATAGFMKATQQAMEFDQALATIGAISGKTTGEVGELGEKAMEASSQFGVAVSEMTEGLESLARAGVSTNNMYGILTEAMGLSKLEGLSLNTAINDLISTTNLLDTKGLDLESPEYVEAVKYQNQKITATSEAAPINAQDIIHTLEHIGGYASSTNLDQDDLYAVIAQLGSKGTKSEMAGTSLRAFISAGQKDTAQRALERIGLNVKDLWKDDETIMSITDMKDVLDEAMEAKGYTQQEKLEFYSDFAGYKQANQIMKIDTQSAREFKEKIDHSWNMGQKIAQVIGTAETHVKGLIQSGTNLLTKVGQPFLPIISTIAVTLKTGIDIINAIPGSNLVIAGGLILASIKTISTIFNKIVPQIVAAKGNIGGISGLFKGMKEDLQESYTILKNIDNIDWMQKQAHQNEMNRITNDEKIKYWRNRTGKRLYGITDVYRLEKRHGFKDDQPYIDWKKREKYKTRESRNERHKTQNEPTGTTESSNNRKDNKKTDCCDSIVKAINSIHELLKSGNIFPSQDVATDIGTVKIDDSIIKELKDHIFKVEVTNLSNFNTTNQSSSNKSVESGVKFIADALAESEEPISESTSRTKSSSKKSKSKKKKRKTSKTKLLVDGKLNQEKIDSFIDNLEIDFGFDESTVSGREFQKLMLDYAKDTLRDNFRNNRNKLTGQNEEVLKKRINREIKENIRPTAAHKLPSILASDPNIKTYSSTDLDKMTAYPTIDYDPSLKSSNDVLADLDLDYTRISRKDSILKGGQDYLIALAKLGNVDISSIKQDRYYKSNIAKQIAKDLKGNKNKDDIRNAKATLDKVLTNRIAYHYINDLDDSDRKEFMESVGLEKTKNPYFDMANYIKANHDRYYSKNGNSIGIPEHLDLIHKIGNIAYLDKDNLKITGGFSSYGNFSKSQSVKNKINAGTEKAIKMRGETGYNGIASHIKKITDAIVELAIREDIEETRKEMEEKLGREVNVSEVIKRIPSLVQPNRFKWKPNDYDDIGKESPDFLNEFESSFYGAQALHNKNIGGNEVYRNRTFGKNDFGQLEHFKLVFSNKKPSVFYENEMEELSNLPFQSLLALVQPPEITKATEDVGPKKLDGNNTGTKNVGVAEIRNLPYIFEGTSIQKMGIRLPTHGRSMDNTAVMGTDYISPEVALGDYKPKNITYMGKTIAQEVDTLKGFVRNDKGRYHEATNWALTQKRNRETMRENQKIAFGAIAQQYDISRQDIMGMPLTESQQKRINELYNQQEFVNIDQYIKEHGEDAFKQIRGQMSLHKFDHDYNTGKLVDNGEMFTIDVTPQEYQRRLDAGLIYKDEGDFGILSVNKNKKTGEESYTIHDFDALHYSYNDIKRRVLLEDTLRAKELENHNNIFTKKENAEDWANVSDLVSSSFSPTAKPENFVNIYSIDPESMDMLKSISTSDINKINKEMSQNDMIAKLSPDDIAEELLDAPIDQIDTLLHTIYLYNKKLYNKVISSLKTKRAEEQSNIKELETKKEDINNELGRFDDALNVVDHIFPDLKNVLSNKEKLEYMKLLSTSESPIDELSVIAQRHGVHINNVNSGNSGNSAPSSIDDDYYKDIEYDFIDAMNESEISDVTIFDIATVSDEITAEFLEALNDASVYDTRSLISSVGQGVSENRIDKINKILNTDIDKEKIKDYQAINDYFNVGNAITLTFGDSNIKTFGVPDIDYDNKPKYYNSNKIYKETTPGGDEEEPTIINTEKEWNETDTFARKLYEEGNYERILMLYDAMREGGESLSPQVENWARLVVTLNNLNKIGSKFDKNSALIPPLEEVTNESFYPFSKEEEDYAQYWRERLISGKTSQPLKIDELIAKALQNPDMSWDELGVKIGSSEYHAIMDAYIKNSSESFYDIQGKKKETEKEKPKKEESTTTNQDKSFPIHKGVGSKYEFVDTGSTTTEQIERAGEIFRREILTSFANSLGIDVSSQINGENINPNSTNWNKIDEALKEAQNRSTFSKDKKNMLQLGGPRYKGTTKENFQEWLQLAFAQKHIKDSGPTPMPGGISGVDYSTIQLINQTLNTNSQSIQGYQTANQFKEAIQQKLNNFISPKIDTLYDKFENVDNSEISEKLNNWSNKLANATDTLQGFSVYLQEAAEVFPPLSLAVMGLETIISTITKVQKGSQGLQSFLNIGEDLKAGEELTFLNKTFTKDNNAGKLLMSATGMVGEAFETLTTIFWEFLGPIALITAGLIAIKGALDWSYQSHKKYLESLQEEQKEKRSKSKGLQVTNENAQEAARKNRAGRQQDRLDRNALLAQTRLDNANMSRSYGAIEIARQKNDTLWGDYGISAGLSKISGNYESTAQEYDGTSGQIRRIKEATLANPFSSESMNQVASYYDANQLAFGVMDEYKDELGKLYDSETSAMLKYHSDDVRGSPEFQKALDDFVEATGITRDHAQQYLDYMQTEHEVDKASQTMQAQADQIAASTELKVQAIAFGGNPADVLGLNGIEAQQDAMIKAQADMIKMELSGQLWWKAVWSTITTPFKLILSPIFIIADLLSAIWSFITGNWNDAFSKAGRATSRLNVFGEAATYWGAWADTEATDFNSIGQGATDSYNRANYGNVEQTASGGYHPTHYLDANASQDRRESSGGGYSKPPSSNGGYFDHRESQPHYINANRGSYHFLNKNQPQGYQPRAQLNPSTSIGSMLSTIISILTTGLLVGGGIYGLTKILKSDFSIKNILGSIKDGGSGILSGLFKEGTLLGKLKDKASPYTDLLKGSFNTRKDQIKSFFGLNTDAIKDSGQDKFSKLKNEAQTYLKDPETADGVSWQAKLLAKGTVAKENFLGKNAWGNYLGEKIMTDDFSKRKRKGMNAEDRDYLIKRYGLDIGETRSSNQANKRIREELDKQGKWDEAMLDLHNNRYMGDSIKRRAKGVASDYINPWKEYLGGKIDTKKEQGKSIIKSYLSDLKTQAQLYNENPESVGMSKYDRSNASLPVKILGEALGVKDKVFGKAENTDFNALLKNPKEFLSDPRNIEGMARDIYSANKDKFANSDFMSTVNAYRERPDIMENAPLHAKMMGRALDWKDKYLQGDSIQDVLKDPERTVGILKGTYKDIQGGALDDLNISDEIKEKVAGIFGQIKEGAEEGIEEGDDEGKGGNGGLFASMKKKLAGWYDGGEEEYDWYKDADAISFGDLSAKNKGRAIKDKVKESVMGSRLFDWYREKPDEEYDWYQNADAVNFEDMSIQNQLRAIMDSKGQALKENGLSSLNIGEGIKNQVKTKLSNTKDSISESVSGKIDGTKDKIKNVMSSIKGKFIKEHVICQFCGHKNPENAEFCEECGMPINQDTIEQGKENSKKMVETQGSMLTQMHMPENIPQHAAQPNAHTNSQNMAKEQGSMLTKLHSQDGISAVSGKSEFDFCPSCGGVIHEGDEFCGWCGARVTNADAYCPECGAAVALDDDFCQACGTALNPPSKMQKAKQKLSGLLHKFEDKLNGKENIEGQHSLQRKVNKTMKNIQNKMAGTDKTTADEDPDSLKNKHKRGEWSEGMLDHDSVSSGPLTNMKKTTLPENTMKEAPVSRIKAMLQGPEGKQGAIVDTDEEEKDVAQAYKDRGISLFKRPKYPKYYDPNLIYKEETPGGVDESPSILNFDEDGHIPVMLGSDLKENQAPNKGEIFKQREAEFYKDIGKRADIGGLIKTFTSGASPSQMTKQIAKSSWGLLSHEDVGGPILSTIASKQAKSDDPMSGILDTGIETLTGKDPKDAIKDKLTGGKEGIEGINNAAKTGGNIMQKAGGFLKGKSGTAGKVGNVLEKVGGGASKIGQKGVGSVAKGGIGKIAKSGVGKAVSGIGKKAIGGIGKKLATKGIAQVGSKVLGGALMATGIGAPLGLLLESPIGGALIEGAMDLGGKALGAVGGAISGGLGAVGNFLGFGKKTHYQKAGSGGGFNPFMMMPGIGALGALGGLFGGGNTTKNMSHSNMGGLGVAKMINPLTMGVGLLSSIFKNNKDHKAKSGGIGDLVKRILKNVSDNKKQTKSQSSGGNITIQNININTADDPEAIKAMFLELLVELQEQVNPRLVSRTVGKPPSSSTTDTNTPTEDEEEQKTDDENTTTNS